MSVARREQSSRGSLSPNEYQILAEFRYQLAGFLRRRKDAARGEGIQPQQYELLLAVTGLPSDKEPTIKELALQLCLEHHTVVELADRLQRKGLLARGTSTEDKRAVLLRVTPAGTARPQPDCALQLCPIAGRSPRLDSQLAPHSEKANGQLRLSKALLPARQSSKPAGLHRLDARPCLPRDVSDPLLRRLALARGA